MKVAVADACIFIDLYDLRLTSALFGLQIEIHTSVDVFNELHAHQQELLSAYRVSGKLSTHSISDEDRFDIMTRPYPVGLTMNDKTVLYLAQKIDAVVLSGDKLVRKTAGKAGIEYHGILWIIDQLIDRSLISKKEGIARMEQLLGTNSFFYANPELSEEIQKRIAQWSVGSGPV